MKIGAVTLLIDDYDAAIAYFVGTLGFRLVQDSRVSATKRWVLVEPSGGGTRLILAKAATDEQGSAVGRQAGGRVFLFLETDDFARDHSILVERGVTFEERPREEPYGKVAVFRDPYGNRWDLLEGQGTEASGPR